MKQCRLCKVFKPLAQFPSKHKKMGAPRRTYCYECQREYCRQHYRDNKEAYNARRNARQRNMRRLNRLRVLQYLRDKCCIDCGESDVRVLEFDHVAGVKTANISDICRQAVAWRRVEAELAKCVVRCANCHRRKTALDLGWYKGSVGGV
jgi:hypothetical protein